MSDILKNIVSEVKVNDEPTLLENLSVSKSTNNTLNNLDDIDDNIGTFNVKIFGIGGAGCNVITHMLHSRHWPESVKIYALNTDIKALRKIKDISNVYLLGKNKLRGAGSGGDPHIGKLSVEEAEGDIREALKDTHILFIVAGLGKGTGSGASPEIAKIAKSMGILTVAIVNLPSVHAEGSGIYQNALKSYEALSKEVNSITAISNERIIRNNKEEISFVKAFEKANIEVKNTVSEIVNLVTSASEMNMDFADIRNFFLKNSAFLSTNVELKNDTYSKETLHGVIHSAIESSYSNMNIQNLETMQIMANFTICVNTPGSVVVDTRNAFKQITNLNDLTLVSGIDYSGTDTIKISLLVSANSQSVDHEKENEMNATVSSNRNETHSPFSTIDLELSNEEDLQQYKTSQIEDNNGVEKRTFKFSTFDLEDSISQSLDSANANKLITRAMTEIIQDSNISKENDNLKKNN